MSYAAGETANGFEFLCVLELSLQALSIRYVFLCALIVKDSALRITDYASIHDCRDSGAVAPQYFQRKGVYYPSFFEQMSKFIAQVRTWVLLMGNITRRLNHLLRRRVAIHHCHGLIHPNVAAIRRTLEHSNDGVFKYLSIPCFRFDKCGLGAFAVRGITKYYDGTDDVSMG